MSFNVIAEYGTVELAKAGEFGVVQLVDIVYNKGVQAGKNVQRIEIRKAFEKADGNLYSTREAIVIDDPAQLDDLIKALQAAKKGLAGATGGSLGTAAPTKPVRQAPRRPAVKAKKPAAKATARPRARKAS